MSGARLVFVALVIMVAATGGREMSPVPARPNVLFIAVDDLNNALGCYGHKVVKSPNIDRLARRGARFDRAYCQFPLCNPSRTSFLTGLRPDTIRVYDLQTNFRAAAPNAVTLPQLFRQNGYWVGRVGKIFHMGVPGGVGQAGLDDPASWDVALNMPGKEQHVSGEGRNLTPARQPGSTFQWIAADGPDEDHHDVLAASEAIRLLEAHHDQSFFLAVGFLRPHVPWVAPKRFFDMYPLERVPLVEDGPSDDRADIPPVAFFTKTPHEGLNRDERREATRAYYAAISFMDEQVGRVLDALDRLKLTDSTIVVLVGDHGYHLGEHGNWMKQSLFEESARAPLLLAGPGIPSGRSTARLVEFVDMYPTLAELSRLRPPADLHGKSLRPLLADPKRPLKDAAFTQVKRGQIMGRSIRTEQWRYTEWDEGRSGVELYDHHADPHEYRNLATDPTHTGDVERLKRLLHEGPRTAPRSTSSDR